MAWDGWPLPMHQYIYIYIISSWFNYIPYDVPMIFLWWWNPMKMPWKKSHYLRYVRCGKPMVFEGESSTNGYNHIQPAWIFHISGTVSPPGQSMEPLTGTPYARSGRRCRRRRRRRRCRRAAPRWQQRCDATATSRLGGGTEALGDLAWMELDRELDGTGDRELVNDG